MYAISPLVSSAKQQTKFTKFGSLIGMSESMTNLYGMIARVAPTDVTVLLQGESGTGKELAAQTIHSLSYRREKPFIPVNCGALPSTLIEAELFGYERGSFTGAHKLRRGFFERASGGTLFLDEITEMPIELQVHLLRVLETGKLIRLGGEHEIDINTRIIAATNRDPQKAIKAGKLREDLFFRLAAFPMQIPALRHRHGDIRLLARHFLLSINQENNTNKKLHDQSLRLLDSYSWPGNVRELRNMIQRAFILADYDIYPYHFPQWTCSQHTPTPSPNEQTDIHLRFAIGSSIEEVERQLIVATLNHNSGNKRITAEVLGVSLKTLYNKLRNYQFE